MKLVFLALLVSTLEMVPTTDAYFSNLSEISGGKREFKEVRLDYIFFLTNIFQLSYDVKTTLYGRCYDVKTSFWRGVLAGFNILLYVILKNM